jgi:hypothetical protein
LRAEVVERLERPRQPEVGQLHAPGRVDHHRVGRQRTVHGCSVCVDERVAQVRDDVVRALERKRAPRGALLLEHVAQRLPVDELTGQIGHRIGADLRAEEAIGRGDVLVVELRRDLHLARQPLHGGAVADQRRIERLDGDELPRGEVTRAIALAVRGAAEEFLDLVPIIEADAVGQSHAGHSPGWLGPTAGTVERHLHWTAGYRTAEVSINEGRSAGSALGRSTPAGARPRADFRSNETSNSLS